MSDKEAAIAAMKLLPLDELCLYAYYMAEAHSGALENIDKWVVEWKKQRDEITSLRSQLAAETARADAEAKITDYYAKTSSWEITHEYPVSISIDDREDIPDEYGPYFYGGKRARARVAERKEVK